VKRKRVIATVNLGRVTSPKATSRELAQLFGWRIIYVIYNYQ